MVDRKHAGIISVLTIIAVIGITFSLFTSPVVLAVEPSGVTPTEIRSESAPADVAGSHEAIAGNVTELSITGFTNTQTWQGYFGNVSGTIQLADASDNVLYNWTLANPEGEVYASVNQTFTWADIQCFNFTATGAATDESGNGGTTSLYGLNLTTLESTYGMASDDVDGVDETFTLSGAGTHDAFFTANQEFTEGECLNTRIYGDTGEGVNDEFEEVLLYEPTAGAVVFASLLEEASVLGFDNSDYDFEMLVLEDGHGTDVSTTTYYFFVELE